MKDKIIKSVIAFLLICSVLISSLYITHNTKISPVLNNDTILRLNQDLKRTHNLIGVIVLSADIQSNARQILYMNIQDAEIKSTFDIFFAKKSISEREPLFVRDGDEVNLRTIRVINHEFTCDPYTKTIGYKYIPDVASKIAVVCSQALPVYYGEFYGMITVYLSKEPTQEEQENLKIILNSIAYYVSSDNALKH